MAQQPLRRLLVASVAIVWAKAVVAAPFAYITNVSDDTVSVIDTATDTVSATIPVGHGPAGVAVLPDGSRVYTTNSSDSSVSVIDTATNTVIATIAVSYPTGVTASPDGARLYVVGIFSVAVIDTATNAILHRVRLPWGPLGIAVTPDGRWLYVTNRFFEPEESCSVIRCPLLVSVIDTSTNAEAFQFAMDDDLGAVAVNPASGKVYIQDAIVRGGHGGTGQVTSVIGVYDPSNRTINRVTVGTHDTLVLLFGLAVHPDGTRVYSSFGQLDALTVIDGVTDTVLTTVPVGMAPGGVSVTPDGKRVYVTVRDTSEVAVIDAATNTVINRIPVGRGPTAFGQFIGPENPVLTPQPTGTPTGTSTPTATPTDRVTHTATSTATPTATPSSTHTQSPTWTATATASQTQTASPTNTPTASVTSSGTATSTTTMSPTSPPSATATRAATGGGGCTITSRSERNSFTAMLLLAPVVMLRWRRRW